jgi:hypothetical protein
MAKVKSASKSFAGRLVETIRDGLAGVGIAAQVRTEPIRGTKLHRVYATSPGFKKLQHSERQGLVWRIVDASFPSDERFRISMIRTLTPEELSGK